MQELPSAGKILLETSWVNAKFSSAFWVCVASSIRVTFWSKEILVKKKFILGQKNVSPNEENLWSKKYYSTKVLVQKIFWQKKILGPK